MTDTKILPGGSAGETKSLVRARPTHRDLEAFARTRLGVTAAKARRLARRAITDPNPYEAVLGRRIERRMLLGADPTADAAVRNVDRKAG